jgi:hypothetical protein
MRWQFAASLLLTSLQAAACPLCGDSQGNAMPEDVVLSRRAAAWSSRVGPQPDVVDLMREKARAPGGDYRVDRESAASAVLASAGQPGAQLKVVELVSGEMPTGGTIDPRWVIGLDREAASSAKPLLLIRARKWQSWAVVGPIGIEHAGWLRRLSATKPTTEMNDSEWQSEAAFVLPYLENPDSTVAELAYGELARAPYTALRPLKGRLDLTALRRWTADPQRARRLSLYTLLVGIGGDGSDAARIEQQLDAAWKAKDATNLGPMIAASLELGGPPRMRWVDAKYIFDRDRTPQELQAVLLALGVQGGANATIPRERVIDSYRAFISVHRALAGFVAQDLATWNYWDAAPEYIALLHSDIEQHPASRYAMVNYLRQSPRADARAAVGAVANTAP